MLAIIHQNIIGFSVISKYIISPNILNPSLKVCSLENEPSGLLLYSASISPICKRICKANIVSSASISKPLEAAGKLFTNLLENTLYPLNMSLTLFPNKNLAKEVIILFPKE